jgi:predicted NBD/HSP70 family sugar kinase
MLAALDHGPVARSTVARLAGLSPAAVSRQCAELTRRGLLREVTLEEAGAAAGHGATGGIPAGPAAGRPAGKAGGMAAGQAAGAAAGKAPGRPHVPVDIDTRGHLVCGLHIAVTHATLALVDLRGRVVAKERIPHAGADPARVLARIAGRVPGFLGPRRALGLGVATGGWVDADAGVIVDHPVLGWRDVPVRDLLARQTGLPVLADSHSRALARAEQLFGDHRARSSVVHLFAGNVVDAAFAVGGVIQHGTRSAAGSISHMPVAGRADPCTCGRSGCLQAVVSETALAARAARDGIIGRPSFGLLLEAALAGDPRAGRVFRQRARAVGSAAAVLLDMLNPDVLIVVEAGTTHLPGCLEVLRAEVRRHRAGPRTGNAHGGGPHWAHRTGADQDAAAGAAVVATSFGGNVLPVAAGAVMLDAVYADPLAMAS